MKESKTQEKQIPKKVYSFIKCKENGLGYGTCPTCKKTVKIGEKYCKCGQSLNWDNAK